jgi:3-hydroxyacyl-CoA dehydrogenase/enoyl-CoA hydratase/3-hydroxybutyryl-CoA epimerase
LSIRTPEEGYALVRAGQTVLEQLRICPAPALPPCMDSPWAAAWNWPSPAATGSAPMTPTVLGAARGQLGIHPGFGGTVRSVQLIGVRPALELMLKGKPLNGRARARAGLIDRLVPAAELKLRAKQLVLRSRRPNGPRR